MFGLNTYMLIGMGVFLAMVGIYFTYSQHEIKALSQTIATQQVALQTQAKTIAQMKQDDIDQAAANQVLQNVYNANADQSLLLDQKLVKLAALNAKSLGQLQIKINKASQDRMRCLALATGASPNKDEKNAVCPQLLPVVTRKK